MIDEEEPDEPLMTHNSVTRGGWAKSWYILHHHQGFFSRVCERARVLFERAIKSYFVDTLTENQICHPIPAALSENWAFRVFISVHFRMLLPLQYLRLYCMSNSQSRSDIFIICLETHVHFLFISKIASFFTEFFIYLS